MEYHTPIQDYVQEITRIVCNGRVFLPSGIFPTIPTTIYSQVISRPLNNRPLIQGNIQETLKAIESNIAK